jgi:hypothetical protein
MQHYTTLYNVKPAAHESYLLFLARRLAQQVALVCGSFSWGFDLSRPWGKYLSCLIFFASRGKNLSICGCCELSAELFESISQWQTIVSSCDLEQNGGKCKWFCQLCCCWVVFPTCAVKIHSWASCLARRLAQQVALVCGGLYTKLYSTIYKAMRHYIQRYTRLYNNI